MVPNTMSATRPPIIVIVRRAASTHNPVSFIAFINIIYFVEVVEHLGPS